MAERSDFSKSFDENKAYIDNLIHVDKSFDLIYRVVEIGGKKACFYFIDGFCKDEVMEKVLEFFYTIKPEEMPETAHEFLKQKLPYGEIDLVKKEKDFLQRMLSGVPMLMVDGYTELLAMDFPGWFCGNCRIQYSSDTPPYPLNRSGHGNAHGRKKLAHGCCISLYGKPGRKKDAGRYQTAD